MVIYVFKIRFGLSATNSFGSDLQWKGSNHKQSTRWEHISWLKASAFCIWSNILRWFRTQQLILGTGTAIWWVTEPHWPESQSFIEILRQFYSL